ncbi:MULTISPECIES: hypothetical protein [Paraburkholderia]|uniref:hypothetical protein n=1 Tax=Paraburkholderia TaxID=1822464 RepID=UPI00224CF720|nr:MULTISPECIES: hypothetical protein [Paraburkholderia]MCX4165125.1 hypothetical protein [Paraburkholderia megapolitana]MDN7160618.1 hypothetical protein [Paraburkholderia sp. CHISQ3]MDQ6497665.1 hypothetical protein [Paraburkholderia megapolitana]
MPISRSTTVSRQRSTASKTSSPSAKARKNMADSARAVIPAFDCGVIVVQVLDPSLLSYARAAIEQRVREKQNIADRIIPAVTGLTSLYGRAATHELAMARLLSETDNELPSTATVRHRIEAIGSTTDIDCLSNEGNHLLFSHVDRGGCVTLEQTLPKKLQEETKEMLLRLETKAKQEGVVVLLFLHGPHGDCKTWRGNYCSEVLVVDAYEPEPDASLGFSISAMSLQRSHPLGVGMASCNLTKTDDRMHFDWGIFIAPTVEERAMWYLHQKGRALREIAQILGIDDHIKVWRALNKIPKNIGSNPPDDWHEKYSECLGLNHGDSETAEANTNDDSEAEADFDDWDDPPTPPPVTRSRRIG